MSCQSAADVIRLSPFVQRSLSAMNPGADDSLKEAAYEALLKEPFTREEIDAELKSVCDTAALRLKLREMRQKRVKH